MRVLTFTIAGVRYGVAADVVDEVVRAAAPTPLPGAPSVVLGLLDVRGAPVPLLDARRRFGHPPRPLDPDEQFVIARLAGGPDARRVALRVDRAEALVEVDPAAIEDPRRHVASAAPQVAGVVALDDGLLLVHDVARFLAAAEAEALEAALAEAGTDAGTDAGAAARA